MPLTTVAIIAISFWIGAFCFYLYTSKKQALIEDDLERVNNLLEKVDTKINS